MGSGTDAGIKLILEEIRDLKREAAEDRKQWAEERRRSDVRLARIEEKQDRTLAELSRSTKAIAGALKDLAIVISGLKDATDRNTALLKENRGQSREHTALLREIRDAVRSPRRDGDGGNGKH